MKMKQKHLLNSKPRDYIYQSDVIRGSKQPRITTNSNRIIRNAHLQASEHVDPHEKLITTDKNIMNSVDKILQRDNICRLQNLELNRRRNTGIAQAKAVMPKRRKPLHGLPFALP